MSTAPSSASPFSTSIRSLEARCEQVAWGWQNIYNKTLCRLAAVQCPARDHVSLHGPNVLDLSLEIEQRGEDSVVAGILRKLQTATAQTCEVCSRQGTLRTLGRPVKVLCGTCAGPRYATAAITQLIAELEATSRNIEDKPIWWDNAPIEIRLLLPAAAWQVVGTAGNEGTTYATSLARLRSHAPWLQAVKRALDEAVERQEPG